MRRNIVTIALVVLAIATVVLGYREYQYRRETPGIVASPHYSNTYPSYKPVRVEFSKPMDTRSVNDSITIAPVIESERLTLQWIDDRTLTIGKNQNLKPGTSYQIIIHDSARDKHGNTLAEPLEMTFTTNSNREDCC